MTTKRRVLAVACWSLALGLIAIVVFSKLRPARYHATLTLAVAPPSPTVNGTFGLGNATLTAACTQACGSGGGVCNQSYTTGIVHACLGCGTGRTLDARGACTTLAVDCPAWPWCASDQADAARRLHNALVASALVNGTSDVPPMYTSDIVTQGVNWTTHIQPYATAPQAVQLLNAYLAAKQQAPLATGPMPWFDDQTGWWNASLPAYRAALPSNYAPYVTTLKTRVCTRTWLAGQRGECVIPPLV